MSLLAQADRPLSQAAFVGFVFLLRQETELGKGRGFYDFLPGPFSFTLLRELAGLRKLGYITPEEDRIALCACAREAEKPPAFIRAAVADVLERYGTVDQHALLHDIYARYPWYATRSKAKAAPAVYTAGYQGRSVDAFFNDLLRRGIRVILDVRANPVSRKYGFSGLRLGEFCKRLGLGYRHFPNLGISSVERAGLSDFASYQRLLSRYERALLPGRLPEVKEIGRLMCREPAVLMCVEKDARCCHRGRLADAVATATGLKVVHL